MVHTSNYAAMPMKPKMAMKGSVDKQAIAKKCKENKCPVPNMKKL